MSFALNQFTGFSVPAVPSGFSGPDPDADWNFAVDQSLTDSVAGAVFTLTRTQPNAGTAKYFDSSGDMQGANANVARFTYDPMTNESLGLLLGSQQQNAQPYSEDIGNGSGWTNTAVTFTSAAADWLGTTVATLVKPSAVGGTHFCKGNNVGVGLLGEMANGFMWFKSEFYNNVKFKLQSGGGASFEFFFDTDDGTIGDTSGTTPEDYGVVEFPGGWWMAYIVAPTVTNTTCSISAYVAQGNTSGDDSFSPSVGTNGIYMSGAQLTKHALPASNSSGEYIPHYHGPSVAGLSDLDEDVVSVSTGAWFNNTEGTIFIDFQQTKQQNILGYNALAFTEDPGLATHGIWMRSIHVANSVGQSLMYDSAVQQHSNAVNDSPNPSKGIAQRHRIAFAYKLNDSQLAVNGESDTLDTSCTIPTMDTLRLNTRGSNTEAKGEATVARVAYWKTRLTEAQIEELTALPA